MIRISPAGRKYKDWEGVVHPKPRRGASIGWPTSPSTSRLSRFNTSHYGPPRPAAARKWVDSVSLNPDLRFTAKLFHSFTHEREPAPTDERDFKAGIAPIVDAQRLGAILIQFPWPFKNEQDNREYLWQLQARFREYPLVVEVRDASWITADILDTFAVLGLGFCNIDQPIFQRFVKPLAHTTSAVGYVRLHGRSYQNWFSRKADVGGRYDHLYSLDELEPWAACVRSIAEDAAETYAVTNNHNLGKLTVNSLELQAFLGNEPVKIPPMLIENYPQLRDLSDESNRSASPNG